MSVAAVVARQASMMAIRRTPSVAISGKRTMPHGWRGRRGDTARADGVPCRAMKQANGPPGPPGAAGYSGAERAWVLYDVGNSAYVLVVMTAIFPLFFKNVVAVDLPGPTSTAWLAYASSVFTLVLAVLVVVLGPLDDYEGRKKRFFGGVGLHQRETSTSRP